MKVAAIFDIDGTLVTSSFDAQGTRKALIAELSSRGADVAGLGGGTPTQGILDAARAKLGGDGYKDYRKKVFSMLDGFELAGMAGSVPLPGVRETLVGLKSMGVRLAVLTNSGRLSAKETLGKASVTSLFEFVLTREDTRAMKPSPEGLIEAVSILAMPSGEVYYVGDSPFDVIAARGAGVKMVSVATGNYSSERLKEEGADFVIASLSQLPEVLGVAPKP
jgi:phosphoglycolate phosphatase-like HAD superfamily hydrolase